MAKDMDKYFSETENWFLNQPTEIIDTCLVCGSTMHKQFNKGNEDIVICENCKFVWRKNQAPQAILNEFYNRSKAMLTWAEIKKTPDEELRQEEKYRAIWDYIYHNNIESVLDVGCGDGYFLCRINSNIKKCGIDPSHDYATEKGFPLYRSYEQFAESLHGSMKFDMITMFGVLEHLKHPNTDIKLYYQHLKPNGVLCIIVPNVESLIVKVLGTSTSTFCPQHLSYFSEDTLNELMFKHGFTPELTYTIEPEAQPIIRWMKGFHPYRDLGIQLTDPDINDRSILEAGRGYKIVAFYRKQK